MGKTARCYATSIFAALTLPILVGRVGAQQQKPTQKYTMHPRSIADSTFAAALAINDLAEEIRHGTLSTRTHNDPGLMQAVEAVSGAGALRKRPDFLDKVPLWDFALDSLTFEAASDRLLVVTARARFTRDSASSQRVTFHLLREGGEWRIVDLVGLRQYFLAKGQAAKGGPLK